MPINAELTYSIKGESASFKGQCINLSHSGIQFETSKHLREGVSLDITIDTRSDVFKPMHATVEVLRIDPLENSGYRVSGKILEYKE